MIFCIFVYLKKLCKNVAHSMSKLFFKRYRITLIKCPLLLNALPFQNFQSKRSPRINAKGGGGGGVYSKHFAHLSAVFYFPNRSIKKETYQFNKYADA